MLELSKISEILGWDTLNISDTIESQVKISDILTYLGDFRYLQENMEKQIIYLCTPNQVGSKNK